MSIIYRIETRTTTLNRLVRVEHMTRYTEVTKFHNDDLELAKKLCAELNNSTKKGASHA